MTSRGVRLVAVWVMALALGAAPTYPAQAQVEKSARAASQAHWDTYSKTVIDYGSQRLVNLNMCVHFNYKATYRVDVGGTTGQNTPPAYDVWVFKNPRMLNPSLDVYFTRTCEFGSAKVRSSRLTSKTFVSAASLTHNFCSFNPSVSVGLPWSVSVGVAPTCGTDKAKRAGRYRVLEPDSPRARFTISSTGRAATWKKTSDTFAFNKADKKINLCFRGRYYFDVQNASGSKSDDITIPGTSSAMCLPVAYWAWLVTGRDY